MNYEEMVESLNKDYLMVRKGRWLSFLGGAAAFVIAAGFVSYTATQAVLEDSAAKIAVERIDTLLGEAEGDRREIGELLTQFRTYVNQQPLEGLEAKTQNITTSESGCDTIISVGDSRKAVFQCDGNFVIYSVSDDRALWNSSTRVPD